MAIDFTPGQPGGETYLVTLVWVLSGFAAIFVAGLLLRKYLDDLKMADERKAARRPRSIVLRALESTVWRGVIGLLVTIVGIRSLIVTLTTEQELPPLEFDIVIWGLVAIPWVLIIDMWREYRHQLRLLSPA